MTNFKLVLAYIVKWSSVPLFLLTIMFILLTPLFIEDNQPYVITGMLIVGPSVVGFIMFRAGNRWAKSLKK